MIENADNMKHCLTLDERKCLRISGVTAVDDYNDSEIHAVTVCGRLLIKGEKLNIETLDLSVGELVLGGAVSVLAYSDDVQTKSVFKRLFSQ